MPLFVKARSFLRNLFLSRRVEIDLDQEVHSHLEMLIEENIRAGMPPDEAQRAARIELGGVERVKEQVRDSRTGAFLDSLLQDLRFALRQMRRSPGKAYWDYYGYHEDPTAGAVQDVFAPRNFRGHLVTLSVRYAF
jgi:hypothetical protein